jgi:16S rRNA U1498 N3-methylase RsmE
MRLRPGDKINIFDGYGREFEAVIKGFSTKTVFIELGKIIPTAD